MSHIEIEQNTDEWMILRAGKLTASQMSTVMANYGKAFGQPAKSLAVTLAVEQLTGEPRGESYSNEHMDRGHEEEPVARALYEELTFCDVAPGGFYDAGFMGASPDGRVGDNGLIEIKSALPHIHFARVKRQGVDPVYQWQIATTLMLSGREWIDFVSYCSAFPSDQRLYVARYYREAQVEAQIHERALEFKTLVNESKRIIQNSEYFIIPEATPA